MMLQDFWKIWVFHLIIARYFQVIKVSHNYYDSLNTYLENFIDGKEFLLLNADEVKAMIPPIGLAKKIIRLLPSSKVTF